MNKKRPLNINPLSVELPIGAKVSITHRVSGILVFLLIPVLLCVLQTSLASEEGLMQVSRYFNTPLGTAIFWVFLAAFLFHFFAGIRHLLMDIHIGDSLSCARKSGFAVMTLTLIALIAVFFFLRRG